MTRTCSKCSKPKPLDAAHFRPASDCRGGFRPDCRDCSNAAKRKGRSKSEQKRIEVQQAANDEPDFDIDVDPLAEAYAEREARTEKAQTRKQRDALLDENTRLKTQLGELVKMQRAPEVLIYKQAEHERSDATACAIASDWHVEETVEAVSVHGLNEYNLDIAKSRAEAFFRNLLRLTDITARDSKITTIYLAMLGDFFSGYIHEELMAANELAPGDAARFVKGLFISGIDFLLRESSYRIEADMIPGNHGRMTRHVWFADPTGTSLETFMYHAVAGRYEGNERVNLRPASQSIVYRRFYEGFTVRSLHGYEVRYGGGVGGLTIPLRKAISRWDKAVRADLTLAGHFHQRLDGGDFLINGSMIGFNQYSQSNGFTPEEPQQSFFLISARKGGQKSIVAPIWLDDAHRAEVASAS